MIDLKLEVIRFANEDVIATSSLIGALTGKPGSFYMPTSQYSGGALGGDYVYFNGTFGNYDGNVYNITSPYGFVSDTESNRAALAPGGGDYTFPDEGVTVPGSILGNIAKQHYDAFSYSDGQYYSNGVSYYESYWQ